MNQTENTNLHHADEKLNASLNRYQSLLDAVNGIIWEVDAHTYTPTFISNSVTRILGYTPEEWMGTASFWENHVYQEDREGILAFYRDETNLKQTHNLHYRMVKADGEVAWVRDMVSVIMEDGKPRWLRGIMIDVTEPKLLVDLEHLEKEVLELNSRTDTDIDTVLSYYVLGIEKLFPGMKCSILSVNGTMLNDWISPSLPEAYSKHIHNIEIGPYAGSCGAAAYLKRPVFINDIEHDEIWATYKEPALDHNLRASWSFPITHKGDVVAVFGIYYGKVMTPDESQIAILERSANILKIILENRSYAAMMRDANTLISQGQALANFGTWQWDIVTNKVSWSDVLYNIYGLDQKSFSATFEGYMERIHPDDKIRVAATIRNMLATGGDAVFEERIVRPDGEVRHLRSWAKIIENNGRKEKMIGACLDITDAKTTATKMDEIAWLQSHVIRAPLATLMGLITILHEDLHEAEEHADLLNSIVATATELDRVIHEISDKTRT